MYDRLSSIPPMTPALMRAAKVAKKSGEYDSSSKNDIIINIKSALSALEEDPESISDDKIGELLFSISALSSKCGIEPEEALFKHTNAFIEHFK